VPQRRTQASRAGLVEGEDVVDGVGARGMVRRDNWRKLRTGSEVGEKSELGPEEGAGRNWIGELEVERVDRKEDRKEVAARSEPARRYGMTPWLANAPGETVPLAVEVYHSAIIFPNSRAASLEADWRKCASAMLYDPSL